MEDAESIALTNDGGYIVSGWTKSSEDGDVGYNYGNTDAWIVKLTPRYGVKLRDSDTKGFISGALVSLYDYQAKQWQNVTMGNRPVDFMNNITGPNQFILQNGGVYGLEITAKGYPSLKANVTYLYTNQTIDLWLTAFQRPIEKTFSITNTLYENKSPSYNSNNTVATVKGRLTDAHWVEVFSVQGPDVTPGYFGGDSSIPSKSLNDATLHYHVGHGSFVDKTGNSSLMLLSTTETNGNYDGIYFNATDVKNKWGGKNKWVVLQTCNNLRDKKWGSVLGTTHGIFGFANVSDNRAAVPDDFFVNALLGETLYDSWRSATVNNLGGLKVASGIDENGNLTGRVNITAVVYFKTREQALHDHLPDGEIAPEGDQNNLDPFSIAWDCGSNNEVDL